MLSWKYNMWRMTRQKLLHSPPPHPLPLTPFYGVRCQNNNPYPSTAKKPKQYPLYIAKSAQISTIGYFRNKNIL